MSVRNSYNTKQKSKILNVIKNHKNNFMIKDIYLELNEEIGLTTIYRMIDKLVNENSVNKFIGNDNNTYYQYLESCDKNNHFFLKCDKCGNMEHVDCDCIEDLSNKIIKNHKFHMTEKIIIDGVCNNCVKEDNKND